MWRCAEAVTALVVALLVTIAPGVSDADAATDDIEALTTATPAGSFDGVDYVQYDGVFAGRTSTGAFRSRTASPRQSIPTTATVPWSSSHRTSPRAWAPLSSSWAVRSCSDEVHHAGVGYSTTSFGPGLDQRILDPTVPGTYIEEASPTAAAEPTTRSSLTSPARWRPTPTPRPWSARSGTPT